MSRAQRSTLSDWWWATDRVALIAIIALFTIGLVLAFAASPAATGGPMTANAKTNAATILIWRSDRSDEPPRIIAATRAKEICLTA